MPLNVVVSVMSASAAAGMRPSPMTEIEASERRLKFMEKVRLLCQFGFLRIT
ncbi:hypothetical protein sync_0884 [Synechococcus sp. CC9311]|nr:hypothetical protein sync_0884 [Synechococcus sp. CC9311]